jgi:hypothetical protein
MNTAVSGFQQIHTMVIPIWMSYATVRIPAIILSEVYYFVAE